MNILDKNRNRKIVFYGRVSTEHEAQLSALQNQMQWYDDQLKYHSNWELVTRYIDEGITGTSAKKRPQFKQMIEDAKNGEFDLIVTREVCRFARNTVDTLTYTRQLKNDYKVEVFFVEDNIWTMDNDGELRLSLMATLAQDESRKISERVKAGQKISRDNGVLYGNGNILGYDRVNGTYVINEEQAETVRMIYDFYLQGLGIMKISRKLEALKRKDTNGNVAWAVSKISRILGRSTYKGIMAYKQSSVNNFLEQKRVNNLNRGSFEYKKGNFPPIISEEDWNKVQEIKNAKSQKIKERTVGLNTTDDIWLKLLKCKCGSKYRKNKWRNNKSGEPVFGYQCYSQINNGSKSYRIKNGLDPDGHCDIKMIGDWKLNLMAKYVFSDLWGDNDRKQSVIEAYEMILDCYENDTPNIDNEIKTLDTKINKIKSKLNNLIEMRSEGEINKEEYLTIKEKLNKELSDCENNKFNLADKSIYENEKIKMENDLKCIKESLEETIDFSKPFIDKDIIKTFVHQITPLENNVYRWYIDLSANSYIERDVYLEGRKNKSNLYFIGNNDSLANVPCCTGCFERKNKLEIAYKFNIPFELAREYRMSYGKYLRNNQWTDITIEVVIL